MSEQAPLAIAERCLTEVDNLNALRVPNGAHNPTAVEAEMANLIAATKEIAMPYAVSRNEYDYCSTGNFLETGIPERAFMWLGKTIVEHAQSGYRYHKHEAALRRVKVEEDEALDYQRHAQSGMVKVFLSPRMTTYDAPYEIAKEEHLADDDAIRIAYPIANETGVVTKLAMESLLVRNIPLDAWIAMLADPDNLFGKSVEVDNPESALSVMQVHRQLEVPSSQLPEGVVSIVQAVLPYIKNPDVYHDVERQLAGFRGDQDVMHSAAVDIAMRWRQFELDLADSMYESHATLPIRAFIISLQDTWSEEDLHIIKDNQLPNAHFTMTRQLATVLEKAKQNLLWSRAGVKVGNSQITNQLPSHIYEAIVVAEAQYNEAVRQGEMQLAAMLEARSNRVLASHNISMQGGCAGGSRPNFRQQNDPNNRETSLAVTSDEESKIGKKRRAQCVVSNCPTRPGRVIVGGCGVCLGRCQKLFDNGQDPTTMVIIPEKKKRPTLAPKTFVELDNRHKDKRHDRITQPLAQLALAA